MGRFFIRWGLPFVVAVLLVWGASALMKDGVRRFSHRVDGHAEPRRSEMLDRALSIPDREIYGVELLGAKAVESSFGKAPRFRYEGEIEEVVQGTREVGEVIQFERVFETPPVDRESFVGGRFYVVYDRVPMNGSPLQGTFQVDAQHPESMWNY